MKEDKAPFIHVTETGTNFTVKDSTFVGDRPTVKTEAKNTKLIRIKHVIGEISNNKSFFKNRVIQASFIAGILGIIGILLSKYL